MIAEESIHGRTQGRLLSWVLMLADATSPDHQALLAADGTYAHLFRLQAAGYVNP